MSLWTLSRKVPMTRSRRLAVDRLFLERTFSKEIAAARKRKDAEAVAALESDFQFEESMHTDEENLHLTRKLLRRAWVLRVPVPPRPRDGKEESSDWYESVTTGDWCLTSQGMKTLRQEIRSELKARAEDRVRWTLWLSALTGVIGAITGLVALLRK